MRSSSITGSVLLRKAIVGLFATFGSIALLPCGVALADTVTTNFAGFNSCPTPGPVLAPAPTCGTVNRQDGWKSAAPGDVSDSLPNGYDQQVVLNSAFPGVAPPTWGAESLRFSNAYNPAGINGPLPEFEHQTYSKPTIDPAGEGLPNTEYIGQFSFISVHPNQVQPGLRMMVSPDNGHGGRMSYIELDDVNKTVDGVLENGIQVIFYDYLANGKIREVDMGILPRNVAHTFTFWMKLNEGPANDLVRIYIDGKDWGQCLTTWESLYSPPVPESDRLLFLSFKSGGGNVADLAGGGYLINNVSTTTSNGPGPPGCDVPIDKLPGAPTVSAGGLATYRISAHNRGRLTERYLMLCDRIPRETTFVSATRKLRRIGRRRCLFIPSLRPGQSSSFHLVLRVNANAHPGTLDNTSDLTPVQPPGVPPAPTVPAAGTPGPVVPDTVTEMVTEIPPIAKVTAPVRVVAKPSAPPPAPPPVTG